METKTAFIALVGRPNIGKSTLLNRLVGEKVSIVTNKPQTTRNRITGVVTIDETQFVFLDTPGYHQSRNRLGDYMISQVKDSLAGIELAVMLTDPVSPVREDELELIESLKDRKIPTILLFNKIDEVAQKELMIPKMDEMTSLMNFREIIPISALRGEGTDVLFSIFEEYAKPSPHFFDRDDFTDQPERVIVSEIIREKLLINLREELPHGVAVEIESMQEREDKNLVDIHAVIYCERASHKGMIIGKGGVMLKRIATQARQDIEEFLGVKVNLQCWVKVKEDWRNKDNIMRQLGFN